MLIGWAINSAMIILAASTFHEKGVSVQELGQAQQLLTPMLDSRASFIFGMALLFSGVSSTITAAMSGGTIYAGIFNESYDINKNNTKIGIIGILIISTLVIFIISDPFKGLIYSQMLLSIQLPITVFLQIYLTSSDKVMGKHKNNLFNNIVLVSIGIILTVLNVMLFKSMFF